MFRRASADCLSLCTPSPRRRRVTFFSWRRPGRARPDCRRVPPRRGKLPLRQSPPIGPASGHDWRRDASQAPAGARPASPRHARRRPGRHRRSRADPACRTTGEEKDGSDFAATPGWHGVNSTLAPSAGRGQACRLVARRWPVRVRRRAGPVSGDRVPGVPPPRAFRCRRRDDRREPGATVSRPQRARGNAVPWSQRRAMTLKQFHSLAEMIEARVDQTTAGATIHRDEPIGSYFCVGWRLGGREKCELFLEHPALPGSPATLRLGIYFKDAPAVTRRRTGACSRSSTCCSRSGEPGMPSSCRSLGPTRAAGSLSPVN